MMSEVHSYPAIITKLADNDYNIRFVDFDSIVTYGESMKDAINMAEDSLSLELLDLHSDNIKFPKATNLSQIHIEENQTLIFVTANLRK